MSWASERPTWGRRLLWRLRRGKRGAGRDGPAIRDPLDPVRRELSAEHLRGDGLEIGALHRPLWVSEQARVRYLDRLDIDQLAGHYPEIDRAEMTPVDIVDDGETLASIEDDSLDFIIANHQLEHCENPLGSLRTHLCKVKTGGVLYYAIPDRRYTFDAERELVDFDHLVRDDQEGPEVSRREHYLEWSRLVHKLPDEAAIQADASRLMEMQYSIHFHVWDFDRFRSFLGQAADYLESPFRVLDLRRNESENIAVLRRGRSVDRWLRAMAPGYRATGGSS